jgi:hypothetical protein
LAAQEHLKKYNLYLDKALESSKLVPTFSKEGFGPSDHTSFYDKEIPVVYFFARTHDDYHTPNDDIEFLNFDGIKGIADIAYNVAYQANTLRQKAYICFNRFTRQKQQPQKLNSYIGYQTCISAI